MARSRGFEPLTAWFVARYSIQLSYERVLKAAYVIQLPRGSQAGIREVVELFGDSVASRLTPRLSVLSQFWPCYCDRPKPNT